MGYGNKKNKEYIIEGRITKKLKGDKDCIIIIKKIIYPKYREYLTI